jgi:hypothetical protein
MAFDISTFRSTISRKGLLPTNKFLVRFTPPKGLLSNISQIDTKSFGDGATDSQSTLTTELSFHCDSVVIPGLVLLTAESRRYGYGPNEKRPFTAIYSDVPMSFLVDGNGDNIRFFHNWLKLIHNHDNRDGLRVASGISANQYAFESSYKIDYVTNIEILVFNNEGGSNKEEATEVLCVTLRDAFPTTILDVPMNWADNNNLMRLPVVFTCFDFYERVITFNSQNDRGTSGRSNMHDTRNSNPNGKRNERGE